MKPFLTSLLLSPDDESCYRKNCLEKNVDYTGEDVPIRKNGARNKVRGGWKACLEQCRQTPECEFFVFYTRKEPDRNLRRACFLKRSKGSANGTNNRCNEANSAASANSFI